MSDDSRSLSDRAHPRAARAICAWRSSRSPRRTWSPRTYEVLVVDDGPDADDTRAWSQQMAARSRRAGCGTSSARACRGSTRPATPASRRPSPTSSCSSTTTSRRPRNGCASWSRDARGIPRRSRSAARSGCGWRARACRCAGASRPRSRRSTVGPSDREIEVVWGANMAPTAARFELAGISIAGVPYGFDEDMWERRLRAAGGQIYYLARAGLVHRRDARDSRLRPPDAGGLPARARAARATSSTAGTRPGSAPSCACWRAACGTSSAAAAATACC